MQKSADVKAQAPASEHRRTARPLAVSLILAWLAAMLLPAAAAAQDMRIFSYGGPSVPIPDNAPAGVDILLDVSGVAGVTADVDFSFDGAGPCFDRVGTTKGLQHSWIGDLVVTLTSPEGTTVVLMDRINSAQGGADMCHTLFDDAAITSIQDSRPSSAPFLGPWQPAGALAAFNGENPNGTWVLRVADFAPGDAGIVHGFSLRIEPVIDRPNLPPFVFFNFESNRVITDQPSVGMKATAFDLIGSVEAVEYRVLPAITAWLPAVADIDPVNSYSFTVPLSVGNNTIELRARDNSGQHSVVVARQLTYDPAYIPPPTVVLTNVGAESVLYEVGAGSTVSTGTLSMLIEGYATATPGVLAVEWRPEGGEEWEEAELLGVENGQYGFQFNVSLQFGFNYFEVRAISTMGTIGPTLRFLVFRAVTNIPPFVVIVEPDSNREIPNSQMEFDFSGTATDVDGALKLVEYRVTPETYLTSPEGFVAPWLTAINDNGNWEEWSFTAEGLEVGTTFVEVRATDNDNEFSPIPARAIKRLEQGAGDFPTVTIVTPSVDLLVDGAVSTLDFEGTATPADGTLTGVQYRIREGLWRFATDTSGANDWSSWTFVADLFEGSNLVEVRALRAEQNSEIARRTITRLTDPRPRPSVIIVEPSSNRFVPNSQTTFPFSGTASDLDSGIQRVEYRYGPNSLSLGPWLPAADASGDFTQWTFTVPLGVFNNLIQVRAVDTDNLIGPVAQRSIFREAFAPQVTIIQPPQGFIAFNRERVLNVVGSATDTDGTVTSVRYRTSPGTSASSAPWQDATNTSGDWSSFTFNVNLAVGVNTIEVQAIDNDGIAGNIARREVTRQKAGTPSDLLVLTEFTDVWGSLNTTGQFQPPVRFEFIGFHHDPARGWKTIAGDFNGDGFTDIGTTTAFGDFWVSYNTGNMMVTPPVRSAFGWAHNEAQGFGTFGGDFNGDGLTDLAMVAPDGRLFVGYNDGGLVPGPTFLFDSILRFRPSEGLWIEAADLTGDGRDDLVQIDNLMGTVYVAAAIDGGFQEAEFWGMPGFKYDPANRFGVHFGDFNGDGIVDILQQDEQVWSKITVALSNGTSLEPPSIWGGLGFSDDPNRGKGWWVFVMDANGDGLVDLVQLNEFGEFWVAESTGRGQFLPPLKNAILGFEHKPQGPWQVYPANLKQAVQARGLR